MTILLLGIILFIGLHSIRIVAPDLRAAMVARLGLAAWRGLYSVASIVALIVLVDAVYAGPPVLGEAGVFSLGLALLGVLLTVIFLIGLIERRNRTIGRMGVDSFFILLAYLGALFLLYQLR